MKNKVKNISEYLVFIIVMAIGFIGIGLLATFIIFVPWIKNSSGFMGGFGETVITIFFWLGLIVLFSIGVIIKTIFTIKNNTDFADTKSSENIYSKDAKSNGNMHFIDTKSNSKEVYMGVILSVIIYNLLLKIVSLFITPNESIGFYFLNVLFLLIEPIILVPLIYIFTKNTLITRNKVYLSCLWACLIQSFLSFSSLSILFIDLPVTIVVVSPSVVCGLLLANKKNERKKSSLLIVLIIVSLLYCIFSASYNNIKNFIITRDIYISNLGNTTSVDDYIYCITPIKSGDNIFYYAYNTQNCYAAESNISISKYSNKKNIFIVDKTTNKPKKLISNVYYIYKFYDGNLYYELKNAGQLFQLDSNGKTKKIVSLSNPNIIGYYNGYVFYSNFHDNKPAKAVNVLDNSSFEVDGLDNYKIIYGYNNYVYYYVNSSISNGLYKLDLSTKVIQKVDISDEEYLGLITSNYGRNNYVYKDKGYSYSTNKIYIYDFETDTVICRDFLKPVKIHDIIGVYDNKIYYTYFNEVGRIDLIDFTVEKLAKEEYDHDSEYDESKMFKVKRGNTDVVKLIDKYIYYTNSEDNYKIYRFDVEKLESEVVTTDENCVFFDEIDGYIYYITRDHSNAQNHFYRIKNGNKEKIV